MKKILWLPVLLSLYLVSCVEQEAKIQISSSANIQVDSMPGTAPYLTRDNKGRTILSWVRNLEDSSSIFCYAISEDGGKSFGKPVIIPPSANVHPHSENLPKVIFKPSGEIIAVWGIASNDPRNKYAGMVNYAQSFDDGTTWTEAKPLVNDTAGYDQRYSDISLLPDGEVGIIWLDNRITTATDGAALYISTTKGRNGFQGEKLISQPCCECCRTDLFVDSKNNIHVLYRGIIQDSIRDMVHAVSTDGGKTFSEPKQINDDHWVLNGCPHTGPAMTENKNGLHFAWYTGGGKVGSFYTRTTDNGKTFTGYDSISHVGRHPQLASMPGGELVIVWDETVTFQNSLNKRIGLQLRSATGMSLQTAFLTPDTDFSSYPVITSLDENSSVIAYCKKSKDKTYIMCQQVLLTSTPG